MKQQPLRFSRIVAQDLTEPIMAIRLRGSTACFMSGGGVAFCAGHLAQRHGP